MQVSPLLTPGQVGVSPRAILTPPRLRTTPSGTGKVKGPIVTAKTPRITALKSKLCVCVVVGQYFCLWCALYCSFLPPLPSLYSLSCSDSSSSSSFLLLPRSSLSSFFLLLSLSLSSLSPQLHCLVLHHLWSLTEQQQCSHLQHNFPPPPLMVYTALNTVPFFMVLHM